MPTPYNLALVENCSQCPQRHGSGFFCNMAAEPVEALNSMRFTGSYPKGALFFVEGEQPRGVFILCRGRVKLTTPSTEGRMLIVKIANPRVEPEGLREVAERLAEALLVPDDVDLPEQDRPGIGLLQRGEDAHQRRLAGAIAPEQTEQGGTSRETTFNGGGAFGR